MKNQYLHEKSISYIFLLVHWRQFKNQECTYPNFYRPAIGADSIGHQVPTLTDPANAQLVCTDGVVRWDARQKTVWQAVAAEASI
jgi:hypothetical protein